MVIRTYYTLSKTKYWDYLQIINSKKTSWLISRFIWNVWNEIHWPFLCSMFEELNCVFPFIDEKLMVFEARSYCTTCGQSIRGGRYEKTCKECQETKRAKQFSCIYTSAGKAFNAICSPNSEPACGDPFFAQNVCNQEYILYLGCIGEHIKIGLTRKSKEEDNRAYITRLIHQGFDYAIVFACNQKLNLRGAQTLESELATLLEIKQCIYFQEKCNTLCQSYIDINGLQTLAEEIIHIEPSLQILEEVDLRRIYHGSHKSRLSIASIISESQVLRYPDAIIGNIVFCKGEFAILRQEQEAFIINIRDLLGKRLLNSEEGW